jgi:hypothetical protein
MKTSMGLVVLSMIVIAIGYGWWRYSTRDARARDSAGAAVSMFRDNGTCSVGKPAQRGEEIPCNELGKYLSERMKLQPGSTVAVAVSMDLDKTSQDRLMGEISKFGYMVVGPMRIGFINQPGDNR